MKILGKTVYIFGAGASEHAHAPLLSDFMPKVENLYETNTKLEYFESFEKIVKWLRQLKFSPGNASIDLANLEHVFSLLLMMKESGSQPEADLYKDFEYVICETLDKSIQLAKLPGDQRFFVDQLLSDFTNVLNNLNKERRTLVRADFEEDSVITFNYDLLLDLSMEQRLMPVNYCLTSDIKGYKVLKMHGSMNWAVHKDCPASKEAQIQIRTFPAATFLPAYSVGDSTSFVTSQVLRKQLKCPGGCSYVSCLTPVFIPPTWNKNASALGLTSVWGTAIKELSKAEQLIIIGYSLPDTDTFFRYLLAAGLRFNDRMKRIVVINKDKTPQFEEKFRNLTPPQVKFVQRPIAFSEFVQAQMAEFAHI